MKDIRDLKGLYIEAGGFYDVRPHMDHDVRTATKGVATDIGAVWGGLEFHNPTVYVKSWYQFDTPANGGPATLDEAETLIKRADPNVCHTRLG